MPSIPRLPFRRTDWGHECSQGVIGQIAEMIQLNVGWRIVRENLRIVRIVALPWEHRGDALTPHLLHCVEDAQFIIDHYIPLCRIKTLNLGKFLLLMDIDEHAVFKSAQSPERSTLRAGIRRRHREDDRGTPLPNVLDGFKRTCIKPIGKRIIDEPT